jgi:hypothetical protein
MLMDGNQDLPNQHHYIRNLSDAAARLPPYNLCPAHAVLRFVALCEATLARVSNLEAVCGLIEYRFSVLG